jgi:hypothetical protein
VSTLEDWIQAATAELGIEVADDATTLVLDLARDVAHGVARPAAPLTAYLLGLAAGRAADPAAASRELAERLSTMAKSW